MMADFIHTMWETRKRKEKERELTQQYWQVFTESVDWYNDGLLVYVTKTSFQAFWLYSLRQYTVFHPSKVVCKDYPKIVVKDNWNETQGLEWNTVTVSVHGTRYYYQLFNNNTQAAKSNALATS